MINRDELLKKLDFAEWNEIEFKSASSNAPQSALKTASAFANTNGGIIVFGVSEINGKLKITGVKDVDRFHNEFLTLTRNPEKFSTHLPILAEALHFEEGHVLCFHIPEAQTEDKPVFLKGDIRASYIRKGANDFRCDREELMDFLRNSSARITFDNEPIETDAKSFYDKESLTWYRSKFENRRTKEESDIKDIAFLKKHGFIIESKERQVPTRAAVLLFGNQQNFQRCLPKMVVDLQWYNHRQEEYCPIKRWNDREIVEVNLIKAWQTINNFFEKHSLRPFVLNPVTLQRVDDPPEQSTYREAAINLLIHQDYGAIGRNAEIRIYEDKVEFHNPGNAFIPRRQLLIAGQKKNRNPMIVNAFRRIGLSEQAGSGIPQVFTNWRLLGYAPPSIDDDKSNRTFRLQFPKHKLIEDEQSEAIKATGVVLNEKQASVLAYIIKFGVANTLDLMALTGLFSSEAVQIAESLVKIGLAKQESTTEVKFVLAKDYESTEKPKVPSVNQKDTKTTSLATVTKIENEILNLLDEPKSLAQIVNELEYVDRKNFNKNHFRSLLKEGAVAMTNPDNPRSSKQKYVITEFGRQLRRT